MKLGKIHVAVIVAVVVAVAIVGFLAQLDSEPATVVRENPEIEIHSTDKDLTQQEQKAIGMVQNYQGTDNQGENLAHVIGQVIESRYSSDVIYSPTTKLGWSAYTDPDDQNLYGVTFDFESDSDAFSFLWYVDMRNDSIHAASDGGEELLNIVNAN